MKKLITTLAILLSTTLSAQLYITNDFNDWSFTNSAGLESYGAITTTLAGGSPYPNSDTTTMTSPEYIANGNIDINFTLTGSIEDGYDFVYFQYSRGNEWITLSSHTGEQVDKDFNAYLESVKGSIWFRFALVSDYSVNTYGKPIPNQCNANEYLMYFDVTYWDIIGDNALPVVMDYFYADCEVVSWATQSEMNSSHFRLGYGTDGIGYTPYINDITAQGFSNELHEYSRNHDKTEGYFMLLMIDIDGTITDALEAHLECIGGAYEMTNINDKEIQGYYNLMGQEVKIDATGVKVILYTDGTTKKVY